MQLSKVQIAYGKLLDNQFSQMLWQNNLSGPCLNNWCIAFSCYQWILGPEWKSFNLKHMRCMSVRKSLISRNVIIVHNFLMYNIKFGPWCLISVLLADIQMFMDVYCMKVSRNASVVVWPGYCLYLSNKNNTFLDYVVMLSDISSIGSTTLFSG